MAGVPRTLLDIALAMQFDIRPALKVGLTRETHDRAGVAIGIIPEIVFLTIAQDDKGSAESDCA